MNRQKLPYKSRKFSQKALLRTPFFWILQPRNKYLYLPGFGHIPILGTGCSLRKAPPQSMIRLQRFPHSFFRKKPLPRWPQTAEFAYICNRIKLKTKCLCKKKQNEFSCFFCSTEKHRTQNRVLIRRCSVRIQTYNERAFSSCSPVLNTAKYSTENKQSESSRLLAWTVLLVGGGSLGGNLR